MPTRNRLALQRILGGNPTANCGPQSSIPARTTRDATGQRAQLTADRYGEFLQFVANALHDVGNIPPAQIQRTVAALAQWLGADDPLGALHSLQNGQLLQLLGEVAPVVAQWIADSFGLIQAGGSSRAGGRSSVSRLRGGRGISGGFRRAGQRQAVGSFNPWQLFNTGTGAIQFLNPALAALFTFGGRLLPGITFGGARGGGGGGSVSIDPGPPLNAPLGFTPTPNPTGNPNTIDVAPGPNFPPGDGNVLVIPGN